MSCRKEPTKLERKERSSSSTQTFTSAVFRSTAAQLVGLLTVLFPNALICFRGWRAPRGSWRLGVTGASEQAARYERYAEQEKSNTESDRGFNSLELKLIKYNSYTCFKTNKLKKKKSAEGTAALLQHWSWSQELHLKHSAAQHPDPLRRCTRRLNAAPRGSELPLSHKAPHRHPAARTASRRDSARTRLVAEAPQRSPAGRHGCWQSCAPLPAFKGINVRRHALRAANRLLQLRAGSANQRSFSGACALQNKGSEREGWWGCAHARCLTSGSGRNGWSASVVSHVGSVRGAERGGALRDAVGPLVPDPGGGVHRGAGAAGHAGEGCELQPAEPARGAVRMRPGGAAGSGGPGGAVRVAAALRCTAGRRSLSAALRFCRQIRYGRHDSRAPRAVRWDTGTPMGDSMYRMFR